MAVFYRIDYDQHQYRHELTAHTLELEDGLEKAVYRRFLDCQAKLQIEIQSVHDPVTGVRRLAACLHNTSDQPVILRQLDVGIVLPARKAHLHYFTSDWGSEFYPQEKQLKHSFQFASVSGRSSKGFIPWAGLTVDTVNGHQSWAMALAWSGSWTCIAEPDFASDQVYLSMGISGDDFYTTIDPGECYTSAAVYVAAGCDLEAASLGMRRYFRKFLSLSRDGCTTDIPLEYNGWWPHEDRLINETVFLDNARMAKELGCRYAVMDAGWFGQSSDTLNWYDKRGDWSLINEQDFPSGIKALCDQVKQLGILPGLWCEIEAVGASADLLESRPELIARRDGRSLGYVCLGTAAGFAWALDVVDTILGTYGAKWIKFDYNLDPAPGCNQPDHDHGPGDGLMKHYQAYYQMLALIRQRYPDVVIENCSSGGLRLDIEMLSHTHWTHLSDPDYTEFHLQCFWGALTYLHQSACLHFSWSEVLGDHNLGIRQPITATMPQARFDWIIRAVLMGIPGFSYSLPDMPQWCLDRLKEHCAWYADNYADFVRDGDIHRLTGQPIMGGKGERYPVFELVSHRQDAWLFAFRLDGAAASQHIVLRGLVPDALYRVDWIDIMRKEVLPGSQLMGYGLTIDGLSENESVLICMQKMADDQNDQDNRGV